MSENSYFMNSLTAQMPVVIALGKQHIFSIFGSSTNVCTIIICPEVQMECGKQKIRKIIYFITGTTIFLPIVYMVASYLQGQSRNDKFAGILLTGTHHMGPDFNITQFYLNGYSGSNVGREGGGGSDVCCVSLPQKWRPGLMVDLRWTVGDWRKENPVETSQQNLNSLNFQSYRASVPVERYEVPEHVYVHFFQDGKARVLSSAVGVVNPAHPIPYKDPRGGANATVGVLVDEIFTTAELSEQPARTNEKDELFRGNDDE